jgi:hypothetical protein
MTETIRFAVVRWDRRSGLLVVVEVTEVQDMSRAGTASNTVTQTVHPAFPVTESTAEKDVVTIVAHAHNLPRAAVALVEVVHV